MNACILTLKPQPCVKSARFPSLQHCVPQGAAVSARHRVAHMRSTSIQESNHAWTRVTLGRQGDDQCLGLNALG